MWMKGSLHSISRDSLQARCKAEGCCVEIRTNYRRVASKGGLYKGYMGGIYGVFSHNGELHVGYMRLM